MKQLREDKLMSQINYPTLNGRPKHISPQTNEPDPLKTKPSARSQAALTWSMKLAQDHKLLKLYKALDMAG